MKLKENNQKSREVNGVIVANMKRTIIQLSIMKLVEIKKEFKLK